MSTSHEGPTNAAEVVETVAREAGLSPSLRATVVEAAVAAAAAADKVSASATYLPKTAMLRWLLLCFAFVIQGIWRRVRPSEYVFGEA